MSEGSIISSPNPYRPRVCWYGVPVPGHSRDVQPCGLDARLYRITRADALGAFRSFPSGMTVWCCQLHKAEMEKRGYSLTLCTESSIT
jgi:hypothetical protein